MEAKRPVLRLFNATMTNVKDPQQSARMVFQGHPHCVRSRRPMLSLFEIAYQSHVNSILGPMTNWDFRLTREFEDILEVPLYRLRKIFGYQINYDGPRDFYYYPEMRQVRWCENCGLFTNDFRFFIRMMFPECPGYSLGLHAPVRYPVPPPLDTLMHYPIIRDIQ